MSARGDRERDLAALERELAFEYRTRAADALPGADRHVVQRITGLAGLHLRAAGLLEQLAIIYDELDRQQKADRLRRTS